MRILVVDDFAPWRRFISSFVQKQPGWQVIGEVADGEEAVQKAEALMPDLILLDVGLPKLSGIEAARRICKVAPNSKILFLSAYGSLDVVEEALGTGGSGYLLKASVGSELVRAVEAVCQGSQFVSSRLIGRRPVVVERTIASADFGRTEVLARTWTSALSSKTAIMRFHEAHFYSDDESFLDGFTDYIEAALNAGKTAVVFATEPHRNGLVPRLEAHHLDIASAMGRGRYIALDAADTLAKFMAGGLPDRDRFLNAIDSLFTSAALATKGSPARIAFCGECAPLLWARGEGEAAIRLERLLNEALEVHDLEVLCAFPSRNVQSAEDRHIFQTICAEHSAVHSR